MVRSLTTLMSRLVNGQRTATTVCESALGSVGNGISAAVVGFDRWVIDWTLTRAVPRFFTSFGAVFAALFAAVSPRRPVVAWAVTVLGLGAIGVFFFTVRAELVVAIDREDGGYYVEAAPGVGYQYRWDRDGDGLWDDEGMVPDDSWTDLAGIPVDVQPGQEKLIRVEVKNAFGFVRTKELMLRRPRIDRSGADYNQMSVPMMVTQ